LNPLINYIFNELEATKSVGIYSNITSVINSEFISTNSKLLKEIVNKLTEDSQEPAEYEFACNTISLLHKNSVSVKEFQDSIKMILNSVSSDSQNEMNQIYE
jgi:hypothetical protein